MMRLPRSLQLGAFSGFLVGLMTALCMAVTPVHGQTAALPSVALPSGASLATPANLPTATAVTEDMTASDLCRLARKGDIEAMNQLAWFYSHGKGVERNDAYAAYLFFGASSGGHAGAKRMLNSVSWPAAEVPKCFDEIPPPSAAFLAPDAKLVPVNAPAHIAKIVQQMAPRFQLDPKLVLAVIAVESNFNHLALSPKNGMGLMQLIPDTADRFNVDKPFDAAQNIRGGMAYLRWLLAYYEGDLMLVAAAYNAGEGAVDKHLGVPPYAETQEYVRKVLERVGVAQHAFDAKAARPSSALKLIAKTAKAD